MSPAPTPQSSEPPAPPAARWPEWILRRADQVVVAACLVLGVGATIGWWIAQGGAAGRLVEFERSQPQQAKFAVDVNTAAWPELAELPGIGPTLAQRIVERREAVGPFGQLSDLRQVRGIGPATMRRIEPFLRPLPGDKTIVGR